MCYCRFIHTLVPVPQHSHDVEADGLVGALLQHCGRQTLIGPLQSWGYISNISHICQMFNLHPVKPPARERALCGPCGGLTLPWVLMISLTPWKNPRYLGFGDVWSWMNLTWNETTHSTSMNRWQEKVRHGEFYCHNSNSNNPGAAIQRVWEIEITFLNGRDMKTCFSKGRLPWQSP